MNTEKTINPRFPARPGRWGDPPTCSEHLSHALEAPFSQVLDLILESLGAARSGAAWLRHGA